MIARDRRDRENKIQNLEPHIRLRSHGAPGQAVQATATKAAEVFKSQINNHKSPTCLSPTSATTAATTATVVGGIAASAVVTATTGAATAVSTTAIAAVAAAAAGSAAPAISAAAITARNHDALAQIQLRSGGGTLRSTSLPAPAIVSTAVNARHVISVLWTGGAAASPVAAINACLGPVLLNR